MNPLKEFWNEIWTDCSYFERLMNFSALCAVLVLFGTVYCFAEMVLG